LLSSALGPKLVNLFFLRLKNDDPWCVSFVRPFHGACPTFAFSVRSLVQFFRFFSFRATLPFLARDGWIFSFMVPPVSCPPDHMTEQHGACRFRFPRRIFIANILLFAPLLPVGQTTLSR